jgi:hypothetical protein
MCNLSLPSQRQFAENTAALQRYFRARIMPDKISLAICQAKLLDGPLAGFMQPIIGKPEDEEA